MKSKRPNIILIVLDTVGAKHLSLYGYPRRTTPHMEQMAEECVVYPRCFAASNWTMPSHGSLFTGLYPSQHGVFEGSLSLYDNVYHLASILKLAGYQTLGISANGLVAPGSGLCPDFDYFKDLACGQFDQFLNQMQDKPLKGSNQIWVELTRNLTASHFCRTAFKYVLETGRVNDLVKSVQWAAQTQLHRMLNPSPIFKSAGYTRKTVKLFRENFHNNIIHDDSPFFLFINFMEAHQRYRPPLRHRKFSKWFDKQYLNIYRGYKSELSPAKERFIQRYNDLYDDEIYFLDHMLKKLWDSLKKTKYFDDTLIIITSDHGEHLGEKDHYGHVLSLYNELIWIPLLVKFPMDVGKKGEDQRLVSLTDCYATVLDFINSPLPRPCTSTSMIDGQKRELAVSQSILPEWYHNQLEAKRDFCKKQGLNYSPHILAVITENGHKIIEDRSGNLEVYNLNIDMAEKYNLVPQLTPETLIAYQNLLEKIKQECCYYEAVAESAKINTIGKI
jgi:arylsulfatase A-like enzyme